MAADDFDPERPPADSEGDAVGSTTAGDRGATTGDRAVTGRDCAAIDLARGDRAVVVTQTSLYDTTFGAPCGGTDKVDELAVDRVVSVTAACEDANGDGWVEVAAEGGGPLGWVAAGDLRPVST